MTCCATLKLFVDQFTHYLLLFITDNLFTVRARFRPLFFIIFFQHQLHFHKLPLILQ